MMRVAFLASGRGSNAEALILACREGKVQATAALLLVDRPQAGALQVAQQLGIPAQVVDANDYAGKGAHERAIASHLQKERIDLLCLAGYRRLLSPFLVGLMYDARLGQSRILNIHPADTNAYQGLHGYQWALQNGLERTAITVHYVDEGMDTGSVIAQEPLPLLPGDDLESLQQRGLALEHQLYPRALQSVIEEYQSLCAAF